MTSAIIIGLASDIGSNIAMRLRLEGWEVTGTKRLSCDLSSKASIDDAASRIRVPWDLYLVAVGTYEPLGRFFDCDVEEWETCVQVNALGPLRLLRRLWPLRKDGAAVVFFAGPNPNRANPTYSAYTAGKMILHKLVEDLQAEYTGNKFFILGPGLTRTKMLDQTIRAGQRAAYYERVKAFLESDEQGTSHNDIYAMLKACLASQYSGGRNIHIGDPWRELYWFRGLRPNVFKLRREEL